MKVLVTGGCGYIGSHTVWALHDRGDQVIVLDDLSTGTRENLPVDVPLYVGDVGDKECIGKILIAEKPDAVVHFAGKILPAESLIDPLLYFECNTSKSVTLLQTAIEGGVGLFVFSSTAAVYAPSAGPLVTETSPSIPLTPYGRSKLMVEEILEAAVRAHTFKATVLRYFNVAGVDSAYRCGPAGDNPGHLIRTAAEVALGQRARLDVFGADYDTLDGTCVRDHVHVSDLANAHLIALDSIATVDAVPFNTLNCGYGCGVSVLEVVAAFERVLGKPLPYAITARRPGDPPSLIADVARLINLGWRPIHHDLDRIISSSLTWARISPQNQ